MKIFFSALFLLYISLFLKGDIILNAPDEAKLEWRGVSGSNYINRNISGIPESQFRWRKICLDALFFYTVDCINSSTNDLKSPHPNPKTLIDAHGRFRTMVEKEYFIITLPKPEVISKLNDESKTVEIMVGIDSKLDFSMFFSIDTKGVLRSHPQPNYQQLSEDKLFGWVWDAAEKYLEKEDLDYLSLRSIPSELNEDSFPKIRFRNDKKKRNLLENGEFELLIPDADEILFKMESNRISGWKVMDGVIGIRKHSDGYALELSPSRTPGSITQALRTKPKQNYFISFSTCAGRDFQSNTNLILHINETQHPFTAAFSDKMENFKIYFEASTKKTSVKFSGVGNQRFGPLIDDIYVGKVDEIN